MPVKPHVVAPVSTNTQRLTAKPAREQSLNFCACTAPGGTGLGAVCVECGGQTSVDEKNLDLNKHTHKHTHEQKTYFKDPALVCDPMLVLV